MKRAIAASLSLGTLCCAPVRPPQQQASAPSCIPLSAIGGRRVVAADTLLSEMVGPVNYRNRLAARCPATTRLGSTATIVFLDPQGGQLCTGDRIRIIDPADRITTSPECRLGSFEQQAR